MYGVQLKDRKNSKELMLILDCDETINQCKNSVSGYNDVLKREDSHVSRRALEFKFESQKKKWKLKRIWKQLRKSMKVGKSWKAGKMHFTDQSGLLALIRLPLG